jgi:outer membrane lipoprotein SlyB
MVQIFPYGTGGDYVIARSLRIRGSANAGLYRDVATTTNRRTFTLSRWFKLGTIGSGFMLWQGYQNTSNYSALLVASTGALWFHQATGGVGVTQAVTAALLRDPNAWYHVVAQIDTTDVATANRVRFWVNGVAASVSGSGPGLPALNLDTHINVSGDQVGFGYEATVYIAPTDGLHAELHFVDGQLVVPSAFGRIHPVTGAWVPIRYEGGHGGANGAFHDFRDSSSAAALGFDYSGNGNHLTPAGISVSADGNCDALRDTPTNNYATFNPFDKDRVHGTTSNANLTVTAESYVDNYAPTRATIAVDSGKWYFEVVADRASTYGNAIAVGWGDINSDLTGLGAPAMNVSASWNKSDIVATFSAGAYSAAANYGDVVMIAIDFDAGKFWAGINGVWLNAGNPSAGTGNCSTFAAHSLLAPFVSPSKGSSPTYSFYQSKADVNFGQRDFAYTPPAGFVALNTRNLPPPPIKRAADYVEVGNYDGNGGTRTIAGLRFAPDFVRIKCRSKASTSNVVFDTARGPTKYLYTESSNAQQVFTSPDYGVTAFAADGFTVADDSNGSKNVNGLAGGTWGGSYNYLAMRKAAVAGFDIVTYIGNGTNRTIAHGLGAVPHLMIGKRLDGAASWTVYHRDMAAMPATGFLLLNTTSAYSVLSSIWNNTAPTSSAFSLGTDTNLNANGTTNIMYLWTEVPGFSRIGAYTGNGSTDGPFVWCGFKPRFLLFKRASGSAANWAWRDAARNPFNVADLSLWPNLADAESAGAPIDFLSNGFKPRDASAGINGAGETIVFAAFAETPFKYATAR